MPELLQEACTPQAIAEAMVTLLEDEATRAAQRAGFGEVVGRLGGAARAPSERAAQVVLEVIERAGSPS